MVDFLNVYGTLFLFSGTMLLILANTIFHGRNNVISIRHKTLDLLLTWSRDEQIRGMFEDHRFLLYENEFIEFTTELDENKNQIIRLLNFYESISIGIQSRALHEKTVKKWWRASLVRDYLFFEDYINDWREHLEEYSLYEHTQRLALRWQLPADRKKPNRTSSVRVSKSG